MPTGTVKNYNPGKGFGWVTQDDGGRDLFLHVRDLRAGQDQMQLADGVRVGYTVARSDRGLRAAGAFFADGAQPAAEISAEEALEGLSNALLRAAEWADVLRAAIRARA